MKTHTFAICAYKESKYLEECILSLKKQTIKTNIILVTSTPNKYISDLCEKYDIPLYINAGEKGITQDWNFAYKMADSDYVTITHQDDVYHKDYAYEFLKEVRKVKKPILFFTDYSELRGKRIVHDNTLLKIKRIMLFPLRFRCFYNSRFVRRRILSLGSPICCPSVTFIKENCPSEIFHHGFRADEDWEAWEYLSRYKGAFIYSTKCLMYHRIHQESETSNILADHARIQEDYIMFQKFWPKPVAKVLIKFYGASEQSNQL